MFVNFRGQLRSFRQCFPKEFPCVLSHIICSVKPAAEFMVYLPLFHLALFKDMLIILSKLIGFLLKYTLECFAESKPLNRTQKQHVCVTAQNTTLKSAAG